LNLSHYFTVGLVYLHSPTHLQCAQRDNSTLRESYDVQPPEVGFGKNRDGQRQEINRKSLSWHVT